MTSTPFTLVVCAGWTPPDTSVFDALRTMVRESSGGMLVSTPCLLGPDGCPDGCQAHRGQGAVAMLQPCRGAPPPGGPPRGGGGSGAGGGLGGPPPPAAPRPPRAGPPRAVDRAQRSAR